MEPEAERLLAQEETRKLILGLKEELNGPWRKSTWRITEESSPAWPSGWEYPDGAFLCPSARS